MHGEPVTDASAWTGDELQKDRSWRYELNDEGREELDAALRAVELTGKPLSGFGRAEFPLPGLAPLLSAIGDQLRHGRGFAVLGGVDVARYDLGELEKIYWGLCSHIGVGITQNSDASLIHYVTDGSLRPNQGGRGVGNPGRSSLHVDLTDAASLLCVRQAPDNPPSWVASSTRIHNEFLARHPDELAALYEGFEWDRLDEEGPGESPTTGYRVPVFSVAHGKVSCRYNRYWMAKALKRTNARLPDHTWRLFNLFDEIADEGRLELDFEPGDVQFINNYTVLHGRDAHDVVPDEAHKRLLMRIWLDFDEPRPVTDQATVRYGIVRHGNLGWTVNQLKEGLRGRSHERAADGRPLVAPR